MRPGSVDQVVDNDPLCTDKGAHAAVGLAAGADQEIDAVESVLPIIASDFPIWREIITEANSGVLVNPEDIVAIRDAIKYYIDHPVEAQETGERGYRVATGKYNWRIEEKKLVDFYKK